MKYFFNVRNGHLIPDKIGSDHDNLDSDRQEAIEASATLLKGIARPSFWTGEAWSMHVTDESGRKVFTLRFSASED